ncbi:hypothetical protein ACVBEH_03910 [Roseateles sp. GG27B]
MSADAAKLPVYLGAEAEDGVYVVARIDKVLPRDPAVVDAKRAAQQYAQAWTGAGSGLLQRAENPLQSRREKRPSCRTLSGVLLLMSALS